MNIEQRLKQLHNIKPDPVYIRVSRARLLMTRSQAPQVTLRGFLGGILQSGFAMAVTGLLLVLAIGGFSVSKLIGPLTGWDSKTLLAESQALDIQIHLADLQYKDGGYGRRSLVASKAKFSLPALDPDMNPSEPALAGDAAAPADTAASAATTDAAGAGADSASATSTPVATSTPIGVEEALNILSH